jgi:hypothetical protein
VGIALGDLLQVITHQRYLGEDLMNVFYYRWFSAPALDNSIYPELLDDFNEVVIAKVREIQVDGLTYDTVEIKNLSNGVDFAVNPLGFTGLIPAADDAQMPSYVSMGFQLLRDSLVTRNGYKRFAGVIESAVDGNTFVGYNVATAAIEVALADRLHAGLVEVASPIIVKRPILPPVGSDYLYSSVASALFKGLGTQNTRKP